MIRFCPNCQTERSLAEIFCEGQVDHRVCGWELSAEAIHPEGWRPQPVITAEALEPQPEVAAHGSSTLACSNGHAMADGDLMCLVCGADPLAAEQPAAATAPAADSETVIEGWRLLRQISSGGVRERFIAEHRETAQQAVLTLYQAGAEPDPSVYEALKRLPREHVPEIILTGRWDERAFEVAEELTGGTLAELGIVVSDRAAVQHIVSELGQALHAFSEAGLRHRDLRPATLLVRSREPLDLVISGFGSARLSEFDLDIVSPLETSRYMAPEAIAGGVAAASDWWSLGMILLEQLTQGQCFAGINANAYLIHVLANGVLLPEDLDPRLELLLRGLLARDRHQRWQWPQVQAWLQGESPRVPDSITREEDADEGASIALGTRRFRRPGPFALAAAEAEHWPQALDHLLRGVIVTWAEQAGVSARHLAGLRQVAQHQELEDDTRLMLALKLLNPEMPLILRGQIVTPGWLLEHPLDGYRLISGPAPDLLERLESEHWLSRLKLRAEQVRQRAQHQAIELDEEQLRIYLLSSSRAHLAALWEARQRLLPDSEHHGILSLADRRTISEEDLIVLLSAAIGQFRAVDAILEEATTLACEAVVLSFDADSARTLLGLPRPVLYREVDERISGFARCGVPSVDEWAEQFRLERRMPLAKALVLLAIGAEQWLEPQKQHYVAQILDFFEKKVASGVLRGPLVRMSIGKTTARVDLNELHGERSPAPALLDHLVARNAQPIHLDPACFAENPLLDARLNSLYRQSSLYQRDTGIDGLYLGFPFLLTRDPRGTTRTRIAPLLLWPVKLLLEVGSRGKVALVFDSEREEVRLNPGLDTLLGIEPAKLWRKAADELLGRSALKAADVMDAFGMLATPGSRVLGNLPPASTEVPPYQDQLACAAVLFHVAFIGQAIGEDLRQLKALPPGGTGLETALRLNPTEQDGGDSPAAAPAPELQRFFTVASDPSQEAAVLQARQAPGLLVEGPPGTGKSQTIVNMVADAIGRQRSLLIVCQKHAALEVVHKRLVAEGLGNRVVMLNDINRDREPVIRSVREQLEALFKDDAAQQPWLHQRERLAARIEALEGELDRFHQSLHRVDEHCGLSYRQLIGELIGLEQGPAPLDVAVLRQHLAALGIADLTRLEEACAPLIRLWLPARYEQSALAQLQPFPTDAATLQAFNDGFERLWRCEEQRLETLQAHPADFEVDDPAPYRAWLEQHVHSLLGLDDERRQRLARWLPLFRGHPGQTAEGDGLIQTLQALAQQLQQCDAAAHQADLAPGLSALPAAQLRTLQHRARAVIQGRSWLARLNPLRLIRQRRLLAFLAEQGAPAEPQHLPPLLAAALLESQWRPLRNQLQQLHQQLGLAQIADDCGPDLLPQVRQDLGQLEEMRVLAMSLAQAPRVEQLDAVVLTGQRQPLDSLLAGYDAAFIRHSVRQDSLNALQRLNPWLQPELLGQLRQRVEHNQGNQPALNRLREALPTLSAYQAFRARAGQLSPADLELLQILREYQTTLDAIPAEQLEAVVRRMLNREARLGWKRQMEQRQPELMLEHSETAAKIASLGQADTQMRSLNRQLLSEGIDLARLGTRKQWEDVTRLTGRRSRRLREFMEMGAGLGLMSLRPVWLMNPDVASRVLPLKPGLFDIVIYDEASQMPVEFALPTLYRGRVTVVSGDEKQMPPTAFFSSRVESDEAELFDGDQPDADADEEQREAFEDTWNRREIKDCPDLLQLARSALPATTLQIHYRSAYRELIGFSNASFYGNRLSIPVRHPEANILAIKPLELIRVDGVYQQQVNPEEAQRVVDYLAELWQTPYAERPSVGVVTFNRKQADLIEEHLELRAEQDPVFRAAYSEERERSEDGEDMSVFVKNVENVQGDERDIIVFSSTFGRNGQGSFRRNFGVLGQTGGERRLNVAVTRARRKVVMITSMPIADISDMLTTQRPPASPRDYLQGYLEYARALSAGEFASGHKLLQRLVTERQDTRARHNDHGDGFTQAVAAFIRSLGWNPISANEGDAFGLDFAIEHPDTGLYALGIECDTPRHGLLARARSREIWRPSVLRRAIPHLHRVSSQAWYHDPHNERARLQAAIEQALQPLAGCAAQTPPQTLADTEQTP
ncbi:Superfamily I DNA and/or RNA helicase [Pseudomonas saponiphila]|uniref:Superfamily I DNA and/or RNA helicase n=1 Tax=Pseudomonas saponiphila TaxID=556534 RepID=A0A1H4LD18_9PSED|nr:AAA domain-containing protein [Pseudomonas saponiphila]SEB68573.1 Superfamily I DNA and/or RNA helicase [Pseudomonas saponiphila]